jgi:hypothetical protein
LFKGSNSTPIYIPPLSVKLLCGVWPILVGLARDLPFFPGLLHSFVQLLAQRLERPLPALPDHVDLRVVGDGLQRNVRGVFVDKTVPNVIGKRSVRGWLASDLPFLIGSLRREMRCRTSATSEVFYPKLKSEDAVRSH